MLARCSLFVVAAGVLAQGPAPSMEGKTAGEYYKNIKVLKEIPASELIPSMQFIGSSLGVECDFCHVEREFDKDDKKPKGIARKMIQMQFAINKNNFDGEREVTCNSCHRGATHPEAVPAVAQASAQPGTWTETNTKHTKQKWIQPSGRQERRCWPSTSRPLEARPLSTRSTRGWRRVRLSCRAGTMLRSIFTASRRCSGFCHAHARWRQRHGV